LSPTTLLSLSKGRHTGQAGEQARRQGKFMGLARGQGEGDGPPAARGDHAGLGAPAAARAAKRFAHVSLCAVGPLFLRAGRLGVGADGGPIEKAHAERDIVLPDQFQQALPHPLPGPADEQLRRPPPWTRFARHAAPFGPVPVPPENRRDRPPQIPRRRLAMRADLFDQRLPHRPGRIRENLISMFLRHPHNMGMDFKC
jgi:hypothetical protein